MIKEETINTSDETTRITSDRIDFLAKMYEPGDVVPSHAIF